MEPHITKNIKIFCEKLGENDQANRADSKGWSSPKKMSDWANYYTFDVMGDVVFSRNFDMLKNPDNRFVLNVLSEGIKGLYMVGYMQIILKLQMDKWLFTSLDKDLKRYEAFSKAQSDERMKTEPKTRDAFSFLLEAKDPETGQKFTTDEMISEAGLLITAGKLSQPREPERAFTNNRRLGYQRSIYLCQSLLPPPQSFLPRKAELGSSKGIQQHRRDPRWCNTIRFDLPPRLHR